MRMEPSFHGVFALFAAGIPSKWGGRPLEGQRAGSGLSLIGKIKREKKEEKGGEGRREKRARVKHGREAAEEGSLRRC